MHIVAVRSLPPEKESLAKPLAEALGKTPYEAMSRLRGAGNGPLVVATFKDAESAKQAEARLRETGFDALTVSERDVQRENERFLVRKFEFADGELHLESAQTRSLSLAYGDIELILRGMSSTAHSDTETVRERKVDLGMAVLTGGLKFSKTEKKTRKVTTEEREGFLHLYGSGLPVVVFRESALNYESLGQARQPTRTANFLRIETELRNRCPSAPYDNRLVNRMEGVRLLGPSLAPLDHLYIATAVLARALRPAHP